MSGRNDRRRANELRSGNTRPRRSAGTARPVGDQRTTRNQRVSYDRAASAAPSSRSRASVQRSSRQRSQQAQAPVRQQRYGHENASRESFAQQDRRNPQERTQRSRSQRASVHQPSRTKQSQRMSKGTAEEGQAQDTPVVSKRIGTMRREERMERARKSSRRYLLRIVAAVGIVVVLLAGWAALYNSPAFGITSVEVNGVEHLTSEEMAALANVPADTTLLRVDTAAIESRVAQNAWVDEVHVTRAFPNTLQINVTERQIYAVVEIPVSNGKSVKKWAISKDHIWLMPIPDENSDAAKTTSAKVYEDANNALHIVNVPIGTKAEIGTESTDANVNNALNIMSGLTTDLAGQVAKISAAGVAETTLTLDSGVEIAFGKAEDIRDKERVILEILKQNENNVAYINVRIVNSPTWRAV